MRPKLKPARDKARRRRQSNQRNRQHEANRAAKQVRRNKRPAWKWEGR